MNYKTVNDGRVKGIILTAESLLGMQEDIEKNLTEREKEGALALLQFLKTCYKSIDK